MIQFECLDCGKPLRVDESLAGKRIKCRHCDEAQQVPTRPDAPMPRFALSPIDVVLANLRILVWLVFLVIAGFIMMGYITTPKAANVLHQAAAAADGCFWLILAYAIARAIDSMTR